MEPSNTSQDGNKDQPFRLRVLMEPKGFIRIIEFFLAVLMFATTAGFGGDVKYIIDCGKTYHFDLKYMFGYPFNFANFSMICSATNSSDLPVDAHPGGKASFFVAIGVLAMLYCIATLIWYVFFEVKFVNFDLMPVADLVMTAVFALFFFLASCAWASGVSTVKYWTTYENIIKEFYKNTCDNADNVCRSNGAANYASLNVSIIFGFLNVIVWGGNCWFVFKETMWFKKPEQQETKDVEKEIPANDV